MTSFGDSVKIGSAQFARALPTSVPGFIVGYKEDEISGVPVAPLYAYMIGTASTALASGIFFSATGTGTLTASAVTLTPTGALVSGGVATLDVPRCVAIFCTLSITGSTFTIRGTDAYGQSLTWSGTGASGGAAFATSGMSVSSVAFKTITSASYTAGATGTSTTSVQIGTTDWYGLPYRISNANKVVTVTMDGWPQLATAPLALGAIGGGVISGLATTTAATATTADVRGVVGFASTFIANGTRSFAITIINPMYNVVSSNDTAAITYGVTPFSA